VARRSNSRTSGRRQRIRTRKRGGLINIQTKKATIEGSLAYTKALEVSEEVDEVKIYTANDNFLSADQGWEEGYLNSSGVFVPSSPYRTTRFIPTVPNATFVYTGSADGTSVNLVAYRENKALLGVILSDTDYVEEVIKIPDGVYYVRACTLASNPDASFSGAYINKGDQAEFIDVSTTNVTAVTIESDNADFDTEVTIGGRGVNITLDDLIARVEALETPPP
jgi:hypothetical protein